MAFIEKQGDILSSLNKTISFLDNMDGFLDELADGVKSTSQSVYSTINGKYEGVVHYRIDRMDHVQMVVDQPREPYKGEPIDLKRHKKTLFGMFQGEEQLVEFQADESILDPIFDVFGDKVELIPTDNGKLHFKAEVQLSPTFFGWCLSFGDKLQVTGPDEVVQKMREYLKTLIQSYSV